MATIQNDRRILDAARAVFVADPGARIALVADRAGVGIGALYRRYGSKSGLLRRLCADGLRHQLAAAEAALADLGDPWRAFSRFVERVVDADTYVLVHRVAGALPPDDELAGEWARVRRLNDRLFERTRAAGVLRPGVDAEDLAAVFELVAAVRIGAGERGRQLRGRYLALLLEALRAPDPKLVRSLTAQVSRAGPRAAPNPATTGRAGVRARPAGGGTRPPAGGGCSAR